MTFDDYRTDPAKFIDDFLALNEKGDAWTLSDHQRRVLKLALRFSSEGRLVGLRYLIWGELKKSGKTLLAAALVAWWAFTRRDTEVTVVANDEKQAVGRVFRTLVALIEHNTALAGSATIRSTWIELTNGTRIDAIALDYTGEAGGRQSMVSYDELWGVMSERARRLFEELTPPPSEPEAWVLVTTTAGFAGESELLEALYTTGLQGDRLDDDLELYRAGSLTMFWGGVPRQPWQTAEYYAEQRQTLRPNAYRRLHQNEWVTGTEAFVTAEEWDACVDHDRMPVLGGFTSPTVHAVDFAPKHDFTARVSVQARNDRLVLVGHRIWKPAPGETLDLEETVERDLRQCHRRGNCLAIVADPYQMHGSITRLAKAGLPIRELPQTVGNTTGFSQSLYDAIKGRTLVMYPAADLREQALNAVAVETGRGWRLAKEKTSRKIDGVIALAMAVHELIEQLAKPDYGPTIAAIVPSDAEGQPSDGLWRARYFTPRPQAVTTASRRPRRPVESREVVETRRLMDAAVADRQRVRSEAVAQAELLFEAERNRVLRDMLRGVRT
jgi:phage terminase large subunit-like protein